ncbi:MAG: hypothetical protein HY673_02940, partial [Chloroflexi bacterium]|nr:hypothetical protein [Chloroflexota bacterium]
MRASAIVEKSGIPTVSLVGDGFVSTGQLAASGLGMPNLPMSAYPGHINVHSAAKRQENVATVVVDQVVKGLTVQPEEPKAKAPAEPQLRDVVFRGTLEEVNRVFYENEWSDGLPIIPPTLDIVQRFLRCSVRSAADVIGVLLPDKREATVWNVAVNGVMSGCRPEYMPVLVALVEAMCDPRFGQEHLGCTPGPEVLITINGPIIKDLDFNYEQGALRVGFQANTSIGRFWRLYLRNVAGFLPHKSDKATFGGTWRVVLAENEDAVARIGWEPMSVDQGFKAGDNVITVTSCPSTDSVASVGDSEATDPLGRARDILDRLAARLVDLNVYTAGNRRPQILISPCIAEVIAKGGFSKQGMK